MFLSAWPYIFLPRMSEITQRKKTRSWPALSIFLQGENFLVNWQIWIILKFCCNIYPKKCFLCFAIDFLDKWKPAMTHKCCRSHTWYISGGSAVREFLPLAGKSPPLWTPIRRLPSDRKLPFMSFSSFWGFIQNEIWRTGQILWALGAEWQLNKLMLCPVK